MYESTKDALWVRSIDLAREPEFDLGLLRVRPALCEVQLNGTSQTLQRRVMQVLVALAHEGGSVVSQDELIIRCWRGLSVSDDAIYRCISKLRKLAAEFPETPFSIEAIPGVGYRLTSSTLVEDSFAASSAPTAAPRFGLKAIIAGAALATLILLGAILLMDRNVPAVSPSSRVAVLAFDALSNSKDLQLLSRRIPNEIVNEFGDSQIETVLAEPGDKAPTSAGFIVTGLLRDDNSKVIVDVRVEDGPTRSALWSQQFVRERRQASDLPLEIAARVADMVNMATFARSAKPPLTDNSGLSALLQTTDMIRDAHGGTWAQMLKNAKGLVDRHPEFPFGHSVMASAYGEAADSIAVPAQAQAMREAARRQAELTLKLDPQDAGAYSVLEGIEPTYNYSARERILLRGLKLAKHPKEPLGALYSYEGTLLSSVGRLREALSFQLIARATDEWGPPKTAKLIHNYANLGDVNAARGWLEKAVQRWPNHSAVQAARLYIAGFCVQPSEGLAMLDAADATASAGQNGTSVWRSFVKARAAPGGQATDATVQKIRDAADSGSITRETQILMLAGLGRTTLAFDVANNALDRQNLDPRLLFTPVMRDFRRSPRFVSLADRMGLIRYWRETGKRPDFCAGRAATGECSPELLAALKS